MLFRSRVSSMLRSSLANPDFCSALEDVLAFARGRYEIYYMSDEGLVVGRKYTYEDVFRNIRTPSRSLSAAVITSAESKVLLLLEIATKVEGSTKRSS